MSSFETIVVEVQARVVRGASKPDTFGWTITIPPNDDPDQVNALITDACRRLRDETQGKIKL